MLDAPFPSIWDSTIRSSYVDCARMFYWEYMRKKREHEGSVHLHFGGAFAAGCDTFRKSYYLHKLSYEDSLAEATRAILLEWGNFESIDGNHKTLENCILALDAYFTNYHPDFDPIQPYMTDGVPAVEFSFALPLDVMHPDTGEPLLYCGRFDMVGVFNNALWVVDEKTTTRLGGSWGKQWIMRGQFLGYIKAAQEFGLDVVGAIVRGTAIHKNDFAFAEVLLPTHQWKIDQWWEQVNIDVARAKEDYLVGHFSQAFGSACSAYSGCPFSRLCDTPDPERWVDTYYTDSHWNPLQKDPTDAKH